MRALFGLLCFFFGASAAVAKHDAQDLRLARAAEYRAVLSEIAVSRGLSDERASHDLPEPLREAVEAWTQI